MPLTDLPGRRHRGTTDWSEEEKQTNLLGSIIQTTRGTATKKRGGRISCQGPLIPTLEERG